ncbi:MAG TPA: hypothetical protein VIP08_08820 [Phenylobacterium sp.]|uniref:hypothetical protein n=1 Tax=Phenylobacterium sp. TaxID=1871053 RepID=UPI002F946B2B
MRRLLSAGLALLMLSACDKPNAPEVQTTWSKVEWDDAVRTFRFDGEQAEVIRLWDLARDPSGVEVLNALGGIRPGDGLAIYGTMPDPGLRTDGAVGVRGAEGGLLVVRLTRLKDAGPWDGSMFYSTAKHGESARFTNRPLRTEPPRPGRTTILVYDMSAAPVGARDWRKSVIKRLRVDLDANGGGEVVVHQIALVREPG